MAQAVFRQKGPSSHPWKSRLIVLPKPLSIQAKQSSWTAKPSPLAQVNHNGNTTGNSYMWQAGRPVGSGSDDSARVVGTLKLTRYPKDVCLAEVHVPPLQLTLAIDPKLCLRPHPTI